MFIDIDSVALRVNLISHINQQLHAGAAVLVRIGRNWITITDAQGHGVWMIPQTMFERSGDGAQAERVMPRS